MQVPFVCFDPELPATYRPYPTDAGADVYALADTPIGAFETARVPLNLAVALPAGYYAMLAGRSSVAARGLLVHVGTVDQGYRGQLYVAVSNLSDAEQVVRRGERIAQLIVLPYVSAEFVQVDELPETERSGRGWGSSGR